ncbi:MAG: ketopantoate reductase family protein [Candidatus Thorarchaeota archaeon]
MNKIKLKIAIIGAGSIGSLFGGYIANLESKTLFTEVILFCRKDHAKAINKVGLKIIRNQFTYDIKNIKAYENEKKIEEKISKNASVNFDFIFLTTKAYDIETAISQYKKVIDTSKYLIILQNGIGNEEIVSKICPKYKIIRVITSNGALLIEPGKVIHTGIGITKIGFPFHRLDFKLKDFEQRKLDLNLLKNLLNFAGLKTVVVDDIVSESWEKLFINVGINPIGALTRLRNGELLESNSLKYIMGEAVKEAIKVARMKKINLPKKDYIALTYKVAKKTSKNKNSMLQDILNGKTTEIDFLNGRIVIYANKLGIEVPINKVLTTLIKGLEYSLN